MSESLKKRLLESHNTKITTEIKVRLSKTDDSFMFFKKLDSNPNDGNRKVHIWQLIKQRFRIW